MIKKIEGLTSKEKKVANQFLSLELPKNLNIKYPSQKIQNMFKLNGRLNNFRKKEQKKGQKKR